MRSLAGWTRWAERNQGLAALGAIGLAGAAWMLLKKRSGERAHVGGFYLDAAHKLNLATDLSVKEAQAYLNLVTKKAAPERGGTGLSEDGILGSKTSSALRKFQASNGLPQTGVVDEETGAALSYLAGATSRSPLSQRAVTLSPAEIAQFGKPPVTYTPYPMPMPTGAATHDDWSAMEAIPPRQMQWMTGIQSHGMPGNLWDPRYYDYPSFILTPDELWEEDELMAQGLLRDYVPPWTLSWY